MNIDFDEIFLSYDKILIRLHDKNVKTKTGKKIDHKDLRYAIEIMERKHHNCRWKSKKVKSRKYYILVEGCDWIEYVYFNSNDKSLLDNDIKFFKNRIKLYEDLLKVESKNLFISDMQVNDLEKYFNRKKETVSKAILKLINIKNCRYKIDKEYFISKEGVEWLCKNCFKQKYLEILENYKMELTEKYIQAGYPYDNFFGKN